MKPIISTGTHIGGRSYQEDTYIAKTLPSGAILAAVFDGHGGDGVSKVAKQYVESLVLSHEATGHPHLLLKNVVADLAYMTHSSNEGSTASIVYIDSGFHTAHVAILGDSPVFIFDDEMVLHRSPEHNIRTNLTERNSAVERGAYTDGYYVYNTSGHGLQMSRALGDAELTFLDREPAIYSVKLAPYSFVLVGSDGLLLPNTANYHEQRVYNKDLIGKIHSGANAMDLVNFAVDNKTGDNATAVLIRKEFVACKVPPKAA